MKMREAFGQLVGAVLLICVAVGTQGCKEKAADSPADDATADETASLLPPATDEVVVTFVDGNDENPYLPGQVWSTPSDGSSTNCPSQNP